MSSYGRRIVLSTLVGTASNRMKSKKSVSGKLLYNAPRRLARTPFTTFWGKRPLGVICFVSLYSSPMGRAFRSRRAP